MQNVVLNAKCVLACNKICSCLQSESDHLEMIGRLDDQMNRSSLVLPIRVAPVLIAAHTGCGGSKSSVVA